MFIAYCPLKGITLDTLSAESKNRIIQLYETELRERIENFIPVDGINKIIVHYVTGHPTLFDEKNFYLSSEIKRFSYERGKE